MKMLPVSLKEVYTFSKRCMGLFNRTANLQAVKVEALQEIMLFVWNLIHGSGDYLDTSGIGIFVKSVLTRNFRKYMILIS